MLKSVSLFISTKTVNGNIDFSCIENFNPGMGATQYLFINLAYIFKRNNVKFELYTDTIINLPDMKLTVVSDIYEALERHKESHRDIIILRATDDVKVSSMLNQLGIDAIYWAHNRIYGKLANVVANNSRIRLLVCVSEHQAFSIFDHEAINKTTVILNPCIGDKITVSKKANNDVVFMGTFDKNRGLHVLAKAWPKVRKTVPSARLWVIGGDIYNGNSSQIAYIEKVKKNLGESIHSVYFTGILGKEKEYYLGQSKLAVLNPYGYEALPVTGIEFLNAGLPIVTIKKNGQKEVVKDKYNGLFCKNHRSLADKIILLLENEEMQKEMSENAVKTADTIFNKERFEKKWIEILKDEYCIYSRLEIFTMPYSFAEKLALALHQVKKKISFVPSYFDLLNCIRSIKNKVRNIV